MRAPCTEMWSPALVTKAPQATGRPLGSSLARCEIFLLPSARVSEDDPTIAEDFRELPKKFRRIPKF